MYFVCSNSIWNSNDLLNSKLFKNGFHFNRLIIPSFWTLPKLLGIWLYCHWKLNLGGQLQKKLEIPISWMRRCTISKQMFSSEHMKSKVKQTDCLFIWHSTSLSVWKSFKSVLTKVQPRTKCIHWRYPSLTFLVNQGSHLTLYMPNPLANMKQVK